MVETDLSPSHAEQILGDWLGRAVCCTGIERLHGGACSAVFALSFDTAPYEAVVKLADHSFLYEITGLNYLRGHTQLRVPEPYWHRPAGELLHPEILLIERLPGISLEQARNSQQEPIYVDEQMADILIELHSHQHETYGSVSYDEEHTRWLDRFGPLIDDWFEEGKPRLTRRSIEIIPHLIRAMPRVLADAGPPTLVHGDIWDANVIVKQENGRWIVTGLVDPDAHYADVEYELAYLEVFNTVTQKFFQRYRESRPMRPGYEIRRHYYWLNTLLLHVACFGHQHYAERVQAVASTLEQALDA